MSNRRAADDTDGDLGFAWQTRKTGDVQILHRGKLASTLRGTSAADFLTRVEACSPSEAQQLMARLTGNFKRGNERKASTHPRNR